jgi:general secretion pathway protein G
MLHAAPSNQQGFSLIEMMIVIFILGILAGLGFVSYNTYRRIASTSATNTNLKTIKNAINVYKMQTGVYPSRLQDLQERPKDEIGKKWPGELVEGNIITDGWGNNFYYKVTPQGKHPYELYSYGENGPETGTPEEQIDVWKI